MYNLHTFSSIDKTSTTTYAVAFLTSTAEANSGAVGCVT